MASPVGRERPDFSTLTDVLGVPAWMVWNSFLAGIPAALAVPLFRAERRPSTGWWIGLAAFVAFLPNAPYVLTDVVHLRDAVERSGDSTVHLAAVFAGFAGLFVAGLTCYAFALARLDRWLRLQGWPLARRVGVEVSLHTLSAVGVFIGRVFRFNSWDLVARPHEVLDVVRVPKPSSLAVLTVTFVVIAVGSASLRGVVAVVRRHPI